MDRGLATRLRLSYDKEGDILHIDAVRPHADLETDFITDDIVARTNISTGAIENIEILGFSGHFLKLGDWFERPVVASLKLCDPQPTPAD